MYNSYVGTVPLREKVLGHRLCDVGWPVPFLAIFTSPSASTKSLLTTRDVAKNFKGVGPRLVQKKLHSLEAKVDSEGVMKQ